MVSTMNHGHVLKPACPYLCMSYVSAFFDLAFIPKCMITGAEFNLSLMKIVDSESICIMLEYHQKYNTLELWLWQSLTI